MTFLTSISPQNIDRQKRAISTWDGQVISFNHVSEIESLQAKFPNVCFIAAEKTGINLFGKHYVSINDFTGWIRSHSYALIINSDIIINAQPQLDVLMYSRYDCVNHNFQTAKKFHSGYDAFYLTSELASLIPNSDLYMGQCHWDYLIPYCLAKEGIKLTTLKKPTMFHEVHNVQYSQSHWENTAISFGKTVGLTGHPNAISRKAYEFIKERVVEV